jgi:hypothetical protein
MVRCCSFSTSRSVYADNFLSVIGFSCSLFD